MLTEHRVRRPCSWRVTKVILGGVPGHSQYIWVTLTMNEDKHMLWHMVKKRTVRLFRNGRNQAVRIPREWEFEGEEALLYRDGDRLILEPVRRDGLLALLAGMEPIEVPFPDVDDFDLPLDDPGFGQ